MLILSVNPSIRLITNQYRSISEPNIKFAGLSEIFIGRTCTIKMNKERRHLKLANLRALGQGVGTGPAIWQPSPVVQKYD